MFAPVMKQEDLGLQLPCSLANLSHATSYLIMRTLLWAVVGITGVI
jgi:hypothetical protein